MSVAEYCVHPLSLQQRHDQHRQWSSEMAPEENRSTWRNAPLSAKTCDLRFLPHRHVYLHIIKKGNRSIRAIKYIPI